MVFPSLLRSVDPLLACRAMKNPEKLAASKKKPRVPVYTYTGKIAWVR